MDSGFRCGICKEICRKNRHNLCIACRRYRCPVCYGWKPRFAKKCSYCFRNGLNTQDVSDRSCPVCQIDHFSLWETCYECRIGHCVDCGADVASKTGKERCNSCAYRGERRTRFDYEVDFF